MRVAVWILKVINGDVEADAETCGAGTRLDDDVQGLTAIGVVTDVVLFHAEGPVGLCFHDGLLQLFEQVVASAAGRKFRLRGFNRPVCGAGCGSRFWSVLVDDFILECGALPY